MQQLPTFTLVKSLLSFHITLRAVGKSNPSIYRIFICICAQQGAHLRKYYAWESEDEFLTTMSGFDQIIWVVVESNLKKFPFEIEYFKK